MNFAKLIRLSALLILAVGGFAGAVWAQDTPQQPQQPSDQDTDSTGAPKPKPAARGIPGLSDPNSTVEEDQQPTNWQPDNGPATGLQAPTLGSPELGHSYWVPGFIFGSTIESRPPGQLATGGWYANNYVGGEMSLLQESGRSAFALNMSGGGYFTTDSLENNGGFAQLSSGYSLTLNRWSFQLFDYFSYIPESQFGFSVGTGLALPGVTGTLGPAVPGLAASVVPTQSIYSALGPRYSNAFAGQATYLFSRRASITLGGSYGFLNFTQPGNINDQMTVGNVGFNYTLSPHDTIGVLYRFTGFHYEGEPQALGTNIVNFVYQKKIAQRVALSLFGGPQFTYYRVPINNQSSSTSGSGGVSLTYGFERSNLTASYFHGLTAGSGVLLGSITDQATVSMQRQLTRVWSGAINFGYSRNSALAAVAGTPKTVYDDWFVGGSLSRPIGRNIQVAGTYEATFENVSPPSCAGTVCNSSYTQNVIVITFEMHTRPFVLP
jgi:hypothetical protein